MPSLSSLESNIDSWLDAVVACPPTECVLCCQIDPFIDMVVLTATQHRRSKAHFPLQRLRRAATEQAIALHRYGLWCWRRQRRPRNTLSGQTSSQDQRPIPFFADLVHKERFHCFHHVTQEWEAQYYQANTRAERSRTTSHLLRLRQRRGRKGSISCHRDANSGADACGRCRYSGLRQCRHVQSVDCQTVGIG
jgi:hypothetical protein